MKKTDANETQLITFKMPLDMKRGINQAMRRHGRTQSAIIREAVADWLERNGIEVDASVAWGGYRDR